MKKKSIIFLGGGLALNHTLKSLKKTNIIIVLIDRDYECPSKNYADIFLNIDIEETKKILDKLKILSNELSFISTYCIADYAIKSAVHINKKFNINGLNKKFANIFINKIKSKIIFKKSKIYTPKTFFYGEKFNYKIFSKIFSKTKLNNVVVKPIDQNNNKGISIIKNISKVKIKKALKISFKYSKKSIVEEYLKGNTYTIDCIIKKNKYEIISTSLNLYKQGPTKNNNVIIQPAFFEKNKIKQLNKDLKKLFNNIQGYLGPLTIDIIYHNEKFYFIEMSPHFHSPDSEIIRTKINPITYLIDSNFKKKFKIQKTSSKILITYIIKNKTDKIILSKKLFNNKNFIGAKCNSKNLLKDFTINKRNSKIIYFKLIKSKYFQILNFLNSNSNIKILNK